ncbi:MAG: endopeptidase La [Nitriliruptorales bacterium]|nr:endopeptidase La [Nitriliruptorales bacterium]
MATESVEQVALPLLPLTGGVVVPSMVVNLAVDTAEARAAVDAAADDDGLLVLVPHIEGRYARVGTVAKVEQVDRLVEGGRAVLVRGLYRAVLGTGVPGSGAGIWIQTRVVEEESSDPERTKQLAVEYRAVIEGILERRGGRRLAATISGITDPAALADTAVYSPDLSQERKVEVLETLDVTQRLDKVLRWARESLAELSVKERIQSEVTDNMERTQREYVLRQQLEAIRKELGELGGGDDDVPGEYRRKLADKGEGVPADVRNAIEREIERLERTSEQSPEHSWIRTWLDWMTELPWGVRDEDQLDLDAARAVLDADHTGLEEVKDRIVEQLAVRKLRVERGLDDTAGGEDEDDKPRGRDRTGHGAILTLVGPPGVGKTSLGESVARALGRKFTRVALGGVRDEAEVRGFRRTYVGAQPGRIARAIREAGTMNPVLMLDEVDKVGADWRGDPSAALLEVLDPAQNHTFRDHYLEVDLDLSSVLFIATGNVLETIPAPLLDRMEIIRLDGYTEAEKIAIARDHLLARQLEANGLRPEEVDIGDHQFATIVTDYTREAGVRQLQRELGKLLRKTATRIAAGSVQTPVRIDEEAMRAGLGRKRFWHEAAERTTVPGVATGLAVTGVGGDVLFVEATASDSDPTHSGGLQLTGQLGDVMKESASIALSYLRSHAERLGLGEARFEGRRFHVHVPAGAIPKDGPSAGVTMTTALASLLSGRQVRSGVGMTGEVTLQGKVLPIGGVKQKVLAAHRAGLTEVVLPERNGPDLDDVPEAVRQEMTFHLVADAADLLRLALEPAPTVPVAA